MLIILFIPDKSNIFFTLRFAAHALQGSPDDAGRRSRPDTLDCAVPSLILQPLVENAIRHGIGKHVGSDCIEIDARRDGDTVPRSAQPQQRARDRVGGELGAASAFRTRACACATLRRCRRDPARHVAAAADVACPACRSPHRVRRGVRHVECRMRIATLVVDDEPIARHAIVRLLRDDPRSSCSASAVTAHPPSARSATSRPTSSSSTSRCRR